MRAKKLLRALAAAWAAALAAWLVFGCVRLAKAAWYEAKGLAGPRALALEDFDPVGVQPYDTGEEGPWFISTDGDPQLLWQGQAYLDAVWLLAEHQSPPQAVMLYWKTPGQADFSPRQLVYGVEDAPGVYVFELGGVRVSELRIDPDSQGGVVTRFDGVVLNPDRGLLAYFAPNAGGALALTFGPPAALAALRLCQCAAAAVKKEQSEGKSDG